MKTPETIVKYTRYSYVLDGEEHEGEIWSLEHPEGVECVFLDNQCSCGRIDLGTTDELMLRECWEVGEE